MWDRKHIIVFPKIKMTGGVTVAKPNSVDWNPIRTEYITTKCSYRQLSEKYGVSIGNISKTSVREHWKEKREQFTKKTFKKAEEKAANQEANRLARLITATTKAIDVAMEAFEDDKQFNRYIVTEGIGGGATETTEREFAKVDTKALKDLTGVLKDLTALMRDFYNIPTPQQAEAQRIAAERLELDKKKVENNESADTEVVVKFMSGDIEDYSK